MPWHQSQLSPTSYYDLTVLPEMFMETQLKWLPNQQVINMYTHNTSSLYQHIDIYN